jgi:hypothetical protein
MDATFILESRLCQYFKLARSKYFADMISYFEASVQVHPAGADAKRGNQILRDRSLDLHREPSVHVKIEKVWKSDCMN